MGHAQGLYSNQSYMAPSGFVVNVGPNLLWVSRLLLSENIKIEDDLQYYQ